MKTLLTHIRPHLDDICGLWLLKRYFPGASTAAIDFIPTDQKGGDVDGNPEVLAVGVGRGRFDEHKGDIGECATTLVYKDVSGEIQDALEKRAVEKIVAWVFQEDTGQLGALQYRSFAVPSIIEGYFDSHEKDSHKVTEFGFALLDALLAMQKNEVRLEDDWKNRIEFDSRFGRAVAVIGTSRQFDSYGYRHGFPLVVIMDPTGTYHTVRANAASEIDLTSAYEALHQREPNASWYFHHSKKMLICGGDHAPSATPSTLSMQELIELLK